MDIKQLLQFYDLNEIDKKIGENYWQPLDVAFINDWVLRIATFKGEFHWHSHNDDEFFLVYKGAITIDTEKGSLEANEGQGAVIPKFLQHKPKAQKRALVLMLEPKHVTSTGD